jgi:hypothetical protein
MLCVCAGLVGYPTEGHGFVPTSKVMLKRLESAQGPRSDMRVSFMEAKTKGPVDWIASLVSRKDGWLRFDEEDQRKQTVTIWRRDPKASQGPLIPAWVRFMARDPMMDILRQMKVNLGRTSLARVGTTIVWVIGAGPHDKNLPQVHLERKTGRLRRVVTREGRIVHEVRFDGRFAKEGVGASFPARVSWTRGKEQIVYRLTGVNQVSVPVDVFQIPSSPGPPGQP